MFYDVIIINFGVSDVENLYSWLGEGDLLYFMFIFGGVFV